MAPEVFGASGFKGYVHAQPDDAKQPGSVRRAVHAMATCPSGAIRTTQPLPHAKSFVAQFPLPVDSVALPGVYHLGHHQYPAFGVTPYLVCFEPPPGSTRAGSSCNVMVDAPRYTRRLGDAVARLGGVDYLVLTHAAAAVGHEAWKQRFPSLERVVHRMDLRGGSTLGVAEQVLEGSGPWILDTGEYAENSPGNSASSVDVGDAASSGGAGGSRLRLVHTPGRTYGSLSVWCRPGADGSEGSRSSATRACLLSGGHLGVIAGKLDTFPAHNKAGRPRQAASVRKLFDPKEVPPWTHLLPGFGARRVFESEADMAAELEVAAKRCEKDRRRLI
jgi:glyoxylase-like metal-dependent hydrolase (beta-lactamase superfamily II)